MRDEVRGCVCVCDYSRFFRRRRIITARMAVETAAVFARRMTLLLVASAGGTHAAVDGAVRC